MSLTVEVVWKNPNSPLLSGSAADVSFYVDGQKVEPTQQAPGVRRFVVPSDASAVKLWARFMPTLGAVTAVVLDIEQEFDVAGGTQLVPQDIGKYGGPHPLVVVRGVAGKNGAVLITRRTTFVDASAFWAHYGDSWHYYRNYYQVPSNAAAGTFVQKPPTTTYVLGHTGGMPLLWFASVPAICTKLANPAASCLVFFRPAGHYSYTKIDQPHQTYGLIRYLLTPKPDADLSASNMERDHCYAQQGIGLLMYGRFEDALGTASRAVVMLNPWPSGGDFGMATTAALPGLCNQALQYLSAIGAIGMGTPKVRLGRLGVSAFSFGGKAMWPALKANRNKIDEVYAFDCNEPDGSTSSDVPNLVADWFASRPDPMLRLVGAQYNRSAYASLAQRIAGNVKGASARVTLMLGEENWFASGRHTVWEHYSKDFPILRTTGDAPFGDPRADARHQFAICGGEILGGGAYDSDLVVTYLQTFLASSGFNRS
jgi:hypothetical protein